MCLIWITVNENLELGIKLINSLNQDNFRKILSRVMFQIKGESPIEKDEIDNIKETVNLSEPDLKLLIQSLAYILKQATKIILKPTTLQQQLTDDLKIDSTKSEEIVKLWSEETKTWFSLENRKRLDSIAWELNLGTASNFCNKMVTPSARLQLSLSGVIDDVKDDIVLEMNEEELVSLYKTIENIQIKLDAIHNLSK